MAGIILIIANIVFSYQGFTNEMFFERYKFEVDKVLLYKDYKRLITGNFLHVSWLHLIFNMIALYAFSGAVIANLGVFRFLIVYFGSMIGGDLLALFVHRNHPDYSSVGASGAISGLIFASIAVFPGMGMGLFLIPISIPAWIFGLLFIAYSIYGIKSQNYNIGHEAHLGGALVGMLIALLFEPAAFAQNYLVILLILLPSLAFIYLILTRPHILLIDNLYFKTHSDFYSIDHQYNYEKQSRQEELDMILDKISRKGMRSLSRSEKQKLKEYSRDAH